MNVDTSADYAINHIVDRRSKADSRQQSRALTAEIRHAGGAVIDHQTRLIPLTIIPKCRPAGVGAGKNLHVGAPKGFTYPFRIVRVVQGFGVETPASQRIGIAMDDTDAAIADPVAREHRQGLQVFEYQRVPWPPSP